MGCYQKALKMVQQIEDKDKETRLLECLGDASYSNQQYEIAIECYEDALKMARQN